MSNITYEIKIKINRYIIKNDLQTFITIINETGYKWQGHELLKAVEAGSTDIVACLLANGFKGYKFIDTGNVLDVAIINDDVDIVKLLLKHKYITSLNGFTGLIAKHNFNMIKLIAPYIKYKKSDFCNIAKRHATINNNYEIFNFLRSQWSVSKDTIVDITKNIKPSTNEDISSTNEDIKPSTNEDIKPSTNDDIKPPTPINYIIIKPTDKKDIKPSPILHTLKRSYPNRDVFIYIIGKEGLLSESNLTIDTNVPYDWIPVKTHYGLNWFKLKDHLSELNHQDKFMKDYIHVEQNNPYGYEIKLNKDFFVIEKEPTTIKLNKPGKIPDLSVFINNSEILIDKAWYIFNISIRKNLEKIVIAGYGSKINVNSVTCPFDIHTMLMYLGSREHENQTITNLVEDILNYK